MYNARLYTLTLQRVDPVATKAVHVTLKEPGRKIDQTYRDLKEAQFQINNEESGVKTDFSVLVGTSGELRGVPIQINYQPNWWFQIVLNLKTQPTRGTGR
jgi:2'-5' RNA ligase